MDKSEAHSFHSKLSLLSQTLGPAFIFSTSVDQSFTCQPYLYLNYPLIQALFPLMSNFQAWMIIS